MHFRHDFSASRNIVWIALQGLVTRLPIAWVSLLVSVLGVDLSMGRAAPPDPRPREVPNIIYIIADDQSYGDYGFMGNRSVHTPNLDALAAKSARFTGGYVPTSVCRPSLATLLTGLYPHQHGIHFNHGPPGNSGYNRMASAENYRKLRSREFELIQTHVTLPKILQETQSYRSLQTGKFWEGPYANGGFTDGMTTFETPPATQTFGGVRTLANDVRVAHGNGDHGLAIGRESMQPIFQFIEECEHDRTPWLVWYAPYLPHQPHDSPQRFVDLAANRPDVAEHQLPYYASIAQFDHTVGALLRYLEDRQLAQNTVFVFVSDNGWRPSTQPQRGREQEYAHTKRSKRAPFDDGLRTPILIRWDGVISPANYTGLVSSIDLMPTLLQVADVPETSWPDLPGKTLLPVAKGEATIEPDRVIFGEIYPGDATTLSDPSLDIAYRWVRRGDYKLIVPHRRNGKPAWNNYLEETSLFNVAQDPGETNNLAGHREYQQLAAELQERLDEWYDPAVAKDPE